MAAIAAVFVISGHGGLPWTNPSSAHRWLYRTPLTRLGDFALGILAARLYVQTRGTDKLARLSSPLALGAGAVTIGLMAWPALTFSAWSWDLTYAIPAAVFIYGLAMAPVSLLARFFSLPFMILLGEASYAFYLVHQTAIFDLGGRLWGTNPSITAAILEALTLGAILALAVGLHVTIERPARIYVRRLLTWKRGPTPIPAPAVLEPSPAAVKPPVA
jgi:peptidoglycan/LPS O-acetylase OafA/YrhL